MLQTSQAERRYDETITSAPPSPAATGAWGQADARLARAGHELRRLRYFRDLLAEGFRAARSTDLPFRTLRTERIDLGIGLPELDALPLWASRRDDGAVAIPFVEFILAQIATSLDAFMAELEEDGAEARLRDDRQALDRALQVANGGDPGALTLPRLGEVFLPEPFLARLCGPRGLLDRLVVRCEQMLLT